MRDYLVRERVCPQSSDCDAISLGCLLRGLNALNIYQRDPPYKDLSVRGVLAGLSNMRLPQYCKTGRGKGVGYSSMKGICGGLRPQLMDKVQELENRFGLEISTEDGGGIW